MNSQVTHLIDLFVHSGTSSPLCRLYQTSSGKFKHRITFKAGMNMGARLELYGTCIYGVYNQDQKVQYESSHGNTTYPTPVAETLQA